MSAMLKITLLISCLGVTHAHDLEAAISAKHDDLLLQLRAMLLEDVLTRMDEFRNASDEKHKALQSHLSQIDEKLSSLDIKVGAIKTQAMEDQNSTAQTEAIQSHLSQIDTKLSSHNDKVGTIESQLQEAQNSTQEELSRIISAQTEAIQSHLSQIDIKLSSHNDKVGKIESQFQEAQNSTQEELSRIISAQTEALQSHLSQIDIKLSSHNDKVSTIESQVQEIKTNLSFHESSIQSDLSELKASFDSSDYLFFPSKSTWSEAMTYCDTMGRRLVSLQSSEEWEFVKGLISIYQYRGYCDHFWTEGNKRSGSWFWGSTGEHVAYNWDKDEPSGDGDCAEFDAWNTMGLNDKGCTHNRCFICEE